MSATGELWRDATERLALGQARLIDLWGDEGAVCLALAAPQVQILRLACPDGGFPSLAAAHPGAIRLERALADLHGLEPRGATDRRPWLDHGRWPQSAPQPPYAFRTAEGPGLHQIPVGPVHAGIIEPGHFRFHASGETVVRLEERLGYVHKGVERLARGASLAVGATLAGRVSGDSTVAYAYAYARAVEMALGVEAPPRAVWLRALMAELERIANHLGDFGAVCNDAAFSLMHAHTGIWRERTLRVAQAAFGHRLMMDAIVPGGVAVDLTPAGAQAIRAHLAALRPALARLVELYDDTASLQDRTVGTGILSAELARLWGAGGFVGRASGRDFDARRDHAYAPYDVLPVEPVVRENGDVDARVRVRIGEIEQSCMLVEQMLDALPQGGLTGDLPLRAGEGYALVEGFRGDVFVHVRIGADGRLACLRPRDPSWFQWPLLEAAIEGNIVADFPLCNKSFNCAYSGVDL
ncbi:MAG: hydrogenase expression protein HypE [Pseudomonadota bacterium]|nr:hydrogenase expression protein HypE [Pseudomonadota bacterium]